MARLDLVSHIDVEPLIPPVINSNMRRFIVQRILYLRSASKRHGASMQSVRLVPLRGRVPTPAVSLTCSPVGDCLIRLLGGRRAVTEGGTHRLSHQSFCPLGARNLWRQTWEPFGLCLCARNFTFPMHTHIQSFSHTVLLNKGHRQLRCVAFDGVR